MEPEPEGSGGGPTPRGRQIPIARLAGERLMFLVEKGLFSINSKVIDNSIKS